MTEFLPAITLWQPWATLVAEGLKPFEFRHWPAPARYVHRRIAIHAGARAVRKDEVRDLLLRLHSSYWRETGLERDLSIKLLEPVLLAPGRLPLSTVLCTAILGEPIRDVALTERLGTHAVNDSDRDEHSNWGWPLTDIERLQPFVPARGAQGFWTWQRIHPR